ncbi:tetratricopeptide repeat protein [Acetobacter fallax]|uniref:Tetratricopeptide repeat protein n=1 Tax=Acetobacter fallax TaxID=1737473 RepID=A0ABX0K5D5_9PROT|nr:tetratricopeptide repeat-containing glycosyltransferase family protein [Acetobacter fallax]NHO31058.1 tetratricopeptide repeat protein [Acetobacter fallax]NHO34615.1 tetratricopeptide repeat protein [Acetobacter fallax]
MNTSPALSQVKTGQVVRADDNLLRRAYVEIHEGRFDAPCQALESFSGLGDSRADLLYGFACAGTGRFEKAAELLVASGIANPGNKHPGQDLADMFARFDRRADAERALRIMIRISPHDTRIYDALGDVLSQMGQFDKAIGVLEKSLQIRPVAPYAMNLMAIALVERGDIEAAIEIFNKVLTLTPGNPSAISNLACIYSAQSQSDEAIDLYRTAIQERPDDAQIRLNYSVALLKAGRFAQGWPEHEWRLKLPGHSELPRATLMPSLTEGLDISGKRILITQEEGLGDTLMYLRYLAPLARRGALLHLWVPEELGDLCRRLDYVSVVQVGGQTPAFDWHCPFISLPRVFVGTPDAIGDPVPYLHADPQKIKTAGRFLPKNGKLNVGLVWGGSPRPTQTPAHMVDRRRSASLAAMAPLGRIPGLNLISLQKGPYAGQILNPPEGMRLYDPTDQLHSMDDTAALMMGLDVLVSVDTSVVHLAGALGLPVLLMDRFDNCWRWLTGREDSIWYPDLTIIRQERPRDWVSVVDRVGTRLRAMVAQKKHGA